MQLPSCPQSVHVLVVFDTTYPALHPSEQEAFRLFSTALHVSRYRTCLDIHAMHAECDSDILLSCAEFPYSLVQFVGRAPSGGFTLQNETRLAPKLLQDLCATFPATVQCVLLNTCGTLCQETLPALTLPYVIAFNEPLQGRGHLEFARGFYDTFAIDRDISFAYQEGCRTVQWAFEKLGASCNL